jgi:hypothetical protein
LAGLSRTFVWPDKLFAAAVPTVGFVQSPADLNVVALEGYAETRFIKRAQRSDIAPQTWKRSPLGLRWLA